MIGMNVFYIVTGMAAGALLGGSMAVFNKFEIRGKNWIKFGLMLVIAVLTPIFCNNVGFEESKYIGIIVYGFFCFRVWGNNKPDKELAKFWQLC
jgi:hypothetical protein